MYPSLLSTITKQSMSLDFVMIWAEIGLIPSIQKVEDKAGKIRIFIQQFVVKNASYYKGTYNWGILF